MTHIRTKRALAILLVLCLLVIGGLASSQSIPHESRHAHHGSATHGTVLCSWMCAAGQVLKGIDAPPLIERSPVAFSDPPILRFIPQVTSETTPSRGPPPFSTI